ncbi:MAG TPA: hypothetical protein VFP52_09465, partial [Myxococcales bacterium]|nr:hypothetical protein [Myxococcales bacterium]
RKATHERLHVHGQGHAHGHSHLHAHAFPEPSRLTAWTLFALFSFDPCVAVMPILFAAAPLGTARAAGVVLIYEVATLAAMLPLVLLARAGATRLKWHWLEHYGDGFAGGIIAAVGLAVTLLGI